MEAAATGTSGTPATLVDMLRRQAQRRRETVAFRFCPEGDEEYDRLTYGQLDLRARAIAASLQQQGATGQRVLVVCRPGLDSIAAFFGCVYAGAIAVPVHERLAPRLRLVVPDANAGFVVGTTETQRKFAAAIQVLAGSPLKWCVSDGPTDGADEWVAPTITTSTPALVQYTSGSTKAPKGIVVTHGNLLHNLVAIHQAWRGDDQTVALYWLPQHHDMGLIGAVLEMVYLGCTAVLMSPTAFSTRPIRWLKAISRYRATFTAAPNFAYDRCVETTNVEQRAELDLSSLSVAMNGAEPVSAATLQRFTEAFAPAGFRPQVFTPVYGLAEASLLVSGGSDSPLPTVHHFDRAALGTDRVVDAARDDAGAIALVGCGFPRGDQRVVIVDPETRHGCGPGRVGEIWIAGPSVAQGYLGRPQETEQIFSAIVADTADGPFLRTGDMGFLRDGELFIAGRWKDLVVIRESKYYPNDIELTVQDCRPGLLRGRGAVFAVAADPDADERLVVVQEVARDQIDARDFTDTIKAIRNAVTKHHGLDAQDVVLVEKMAIPTTSSGKIQRHACRQQFLDGDLTAIADWHAPPAQGTDRISPAGPTTITLDL